MLLHLIYLRSGRILLSKKFYTSWREIQEEFDDYLTSLGPWTSEETVGYLQDEYPDNAPFSEDQVRAFVGANDLTLG